MIYAITLFFLCQLAGEVIVQAINITFPGPVLGMGLLFLILVLRRGSTEAVDGVADTLLRNLSLLFVPAAVGVIQQIDLIRSNWLAISTALVFSTVLTLIVTVYVFRLVAHWTRGKEA